MKSMIKLSALLLATVGTASAADCTSKNQPRVYGVSRYTGLAGDKVTVRGKWQRGKTVRSKCLWWSDDANKFYASSEGKMNIFSGRISCEVPQKEEGVLDNVKVAVHVYDERFEEDKNKNYCYSHAGSIPDKRYEFGRFRYRNVECTQKTMPRIKSISPKRGEAGDTIKLKGFWRRGPGYVARCFFWSDSADKFFSLYQPATMDASGTITCSVPEQAEGVDADIKVTVQVFHEDAETTALNVCFSHNGGTPDKLGEFAKFQYAGEHCCDISQYHVWTPRQRCVWSCGAGTRPDLKTPCGECICKDGYVEAEDDKFDRRTCVKKVECSKKTVPKIRSVKPARAEEGDTVELRGSWIRGENIVVKCFWWSDNLEKFYALYETGTMDNAGVIRCVVPAKPEGVEDDVKITVQVYDKNADSSVSNYCFSHMGGFPDKLFEFGKFSYEGNHCCDVSQYHVWTKRQRCVWSCGAGTRPDLKTPCGECVCKTGFKETGEDKFGRRTCARVYECTKKTQPRIKYVKSPKAVSAGDKIQVFGYWRRGDNMVVKCNFWSDALNKFYALYQDGEMNPRTGVVTCLVPALPESEAEGIEHAKVTLQIYDENADQSQLNTCFSHGGTTPNTVGEFGKITYLLNN